MLFGDISRDLVIRARERGVKVIGPAPAISADDLLNITARRNFLIDSFRLVQHYRLDGLNVDFESATRNEDEKNALSSLMYELRAAIPKPLTISFDVAWSPDKIDGRDYNYSNIIRTMDYVFIMSYDQRSQVVTQKCTAGPNSDIRLVQKGVDEFKKLGPAHKLILGLPWYGYYYDCLSLNGNVCTIKEVPFRGVNCSDAAGSQHDYSEISKIRGADIQYDEESASLFMNIAEPGNASASRQIWFDDAKTLFQKKLVAHNAGLAGWGMWNAQSIDYSDAQQVAGFWKKYA